VPVDGRRAPAPASEWIDGRHYFRLDSANVASADNKTGKIVLTEVFSYGCPGCNAFKPYMLELKRRLPANVVVNYVSAS
jgi:thiol:disulfide interchange protein DsbA